MEDKNIIRVFDNLVIKWVEIIQTEIKTMGPEVARQFRQPFTLETINLGLKIFGNLIEKYEKDLIQTIEEGYDCVYKLNENLEKGEQLPQFDKDITQCVVLLIMYIARFRMSPNRFCEDMQKLASNYGKGKYSKPVGEYICLMTNISHKWGGIQYGLPVNYEKIESKSLALYLIPKFEQFLLSAAKIDLKKASIILNTYRSELNDAISLFNEDTIDFAKKVSPESTLLLHALNPLPNPWPLKEDLRKKIDLCGKLFEGPLKISYKFLVNLLQIQKDPYIRGTLGQFEGKLELPEHLRVVLIRNAIIHGTYSITDDKPPRFIFYDNLGTPPKKKELNLDELDKIIQDVYALVSIIQFKSMNIFLNFAPPTLPNKAQIVDQAKSMINNFKKIPVIERKDVVEFLLQFLISPTYNQILNHPLDIL